MSHPGVEDGGHGECVGSPGRTAHRAHLHREKADVAISVGVPSSTPSTGRERQPRGKRAAVQPGSTHTRAVSASTSTRATQEPRGPHDGPKPRSAGKASGGASSGRRRIDACPPIRRPFRRRKRTWRAGFPGAVTRPAAGTHSFPDAGCQARVLRAPSLSLGRGCRRVEDDRSRRYDPPRWPQCADLADSRHQSRPATRRADTRKYSCDMTLRTRHI